MANQRSGPSPRLENGDLQDERVIFVSREEPKKKRGIYKVGLYHPVSKPQPKLNTNINIMKRDFCRHSGALHTDPNTRSPLRGADLLPSLKPAAGKAAFTSAITAPDIIDHSRELKRREDLELRSKYKKVMNFSISTMGAARHGSMPLTTKNGFRKSLK